MESTNNLTTIIVHDLRIELGLSCNEYCVADLVDNTQNGSGWSEISRQEIAQLMGLTKQTVVKLINGLIANKVIERNANSKYLRPGDKWKKLFGSLEHRAEKPDEKFGKDKKEPSFIQPWKPKQDYTVFTPSG